MEIKVSVTWTVQVDDPSALGEAVGAWLNDVDYAKLQRSGVGFSADTDALIDEVNDKPQQALVTWFGLEAVDYVPKMPRGTQVVSAKVEADDAWAITMREPH